MPCGLPNQDTFQPCSRKYSATARPGKICPPVPPAITNKVGVRAMVITCHLASRFCFRNQSLEEWQLQQHSSSNQIRQN